MNDIRGLIEPFIYSRMPDPGTAEVGYRRLSLTYNRFDVAFKLFYLQSLTTAKTSEFRRECYRKHIEAFSLGSYTEPGNPDKDSFHKYEEVLRQLLKEMQEHGFDAGKSLVPLARDGSILNGAHRTAVAIFLDKPVATVQTDLPPPAYDYRFFRERGVASEMLDAAAQTFIQYDNHCYLALVWPAAQGHDEQIEEILARVVYKKCVRLNYNGAHNLLSQTYQKEPWLGSAAQNYPGVKAKLTGCFPTFDNVRAYLFQADSLEQVFEKKERVRRIFNIEKHAIHITDTKEETLRIGRLLFSDNGVHFLNHGRPTAFMDFQRKLEIFKQELLARQCSAEDFVLDSGSVMATYGLRSANDVDYLTTATPFKVPDVEHHIREIPHHEVSEAELVDNPQFYFWYNGLKFVSLQRLYIMKKNRAESKDAVDLALIKSLVKNNAFQARVLAARYVFLLKKARLKNRIRQYLVRTTKRLGLYNGARTLYKKLLG